MLEILGENYYIDVDKIIQKCRPIHPEEERAKDGDNSDDDGEKQNELNVFKFECYKSCLDRVLSEYQEDDDQDVAAFTNKTTNPGFGIAFNTLLKNEILNKDER